MYRLSQKEVKCMGISELDVSAAREGKLLGTLPLCGTKYCTHSEPMGKVGAVCIYVECVCVCVCVCV